MWSAKTQVLLDKSRIFYLAKQLLNILYTDVFKYKLKGSEIRDSARAVSIELTQSQLQQLS